MLRASIIFNPAADRGHASQLEADVRALVAELAPADFEVEWCQTTSPRHAIELARDAAQSGVDLVIAMGGDGTVHEVVNGLMTLPSTQRPALGIIPVGSGNDFAHNIGLSEDPAQAIPCLFSGQTRSVDVAHIRDENGHGEYWNNTLGLGFSGTVNRQTRQLHGLRGFLVYFVAVLRTIFISPTDLGLTLQIDDGAPQTQRISMLSVCNGPREGGGFPVAPNAQVDDGLLTYTIMYKLSRLGILRFLPVVMNANHLNYTNHFANGHARRLKVIVDGPLDIHIDGEIFTQPGDTPRTFEITIEPAALRVMCRAV